MKKMGKMKNIFWVLLLTVLSFSVWGHFSYADPKAFDFYGLYDPSGMLKESEGAAIEAQLGGIHDRYGVSVYLNLLSGEGVKMADYVTNFFIESVGPYEGEIKYGVIFAWDAETKDYYAAPFPNTDDRVMNAFSGNYLNGAVGSSFRGASSVSEVMQNLASALQTRAGEFYGTNASGKVTKPDAPQPGPAESDIAMAKAGVYTTGGEKIPSIYGTVGAREVIAAQTGKEGDTEYIVAVYKTDSIEDDCAKFFTALGKDGWAVTNQEGTYDKGSASVGKKSKDEGYFLAVTVEFRGASYLVNAAKIPGTFKVNE
jgi:hypothetical protein